MKMAPENRRLAKGPYYNVFRKGLGKEADLCGSSDSQHGQSQGQPWEGTGREEKSMNTLRHMSKEPAFIKQEGASRLQLSWIRIPGGKLQETKTLCFGF